MPQSQEILRLGCHTVASSTEVEEAIKNLTTTTDAPPNTTYYQAMKTICECPYVQLCRDVYTSMCSTCKHIKPSYYEPYYPPNNFFWPVMDIGDTCGCGVCETISGDSNVCK